MKKILKKAVFSLFAVLVICISGCSEEKADTKTFAVAYINTAAEHYDELFGYEEIETEMSDSTVRCLRAIADRMIEIPDNDKLECAFSEDAEIEDFRFEDGVVYVGFSNGYSRNPAEGAPSLADMCTIRSLCGEGLADRVVISEGGRLHPVFGEDGVGLADIVTDDSISLPSFQNITLYFAAENNYLRSEVRSIAVYGGGSIEKYLLDELLKGPDSDELWTAVPQGTRLLSVQTVDGICYVNLSEEFVSGLEGDPTAETLAVYSIVNTLTNQSAIQAVQFSIEGENRELLVTYSIDLPIERNIDIVVE